LSGVFLTFKNWFYRRKKIYSNIPLYKIPYIHIININQFELCEEGDCFFDELWTVCDSRLSLKKKNQFVSSILARSRKKHLNIFFTAQMVDQLDKRVRKICDFTAYPVLSGDETKIKVNIFRTGYPKEYNYLKTFWYQTSVVFEMYDTDYVVNMEEADDHPQPKIYFQESPDSPLEEFETWEEADKRAEEWWIRRSVLLKHIF
jgi:hypothetical protein